MLSSLQDLSGLFPGLFQRGQAASADQAADQAAGQAVRNQGEGRGHRHHSVDRGDGQHGRDRVTLSREAQAVEDAAAAQEADGDSDSDGDVADTDAAAGAGSLLGQAGGFIRQALETIRQDLGKALKSFGFDSDAIQNFTQAFVEPVLNALKEGASFTAELSFAALSQVTSVSSNGDVSQSTSLVAQSLEIEVNQDTGEVSVSVAKIDFQQDSQGTAGAVGTDGQTPLLVIDPDDLATPQELAAKILASGDEAAAAATDAAEAAGDEAATEESGEVATAADTDDGATAADPLAALREKLLEDAADFKARLTIYSVTSYQNDDGQTITKLLLDAEVKIASLADNTAADDATAQEGAESLNLVA